LITLFAYWANVMVFWVTIKFYNMVIWIP
jgi:hypothetical protein